MSPTLFCLQYTVHVHLYLSGTHWPLASSAIDRCVRPPFSSFLHLMHQVKKQRKKTVRIPLKVTGGLHFGLSAEQLKASKSLLKAIADKDELKRATEAAKNDLESFIIDIGSIVYDEDVGKVCALC